MPPAILPTVLCVDDEPDNRRSMAIILQREGYRVLQAEDGRAALDAVRDADLVVLDVGLPDVNGFDVCRKIKSNPLTALVPVILLSGHFTRGRDKAEGLEGGGDVYMTKPIDPPELTSQIKALLRIRETELTLQQQAQIIDQIHDAVFATDLAGRIVRWNEGACRIFGYVAGEALGQPLGEVFVSDGVPGFDEILAQVTANDPPGKRSVEFEHRGRRKSGDPVDVHSSFALLRDRHGQPSGIVAYSMDISLRKRLEEQVREMQRLEAVAKLAGGVAHQFNNLLTVVMGFAELAMSNLPPTDPRRVMMHEIKVAGERAASLTQQLLAFGRRQFLHPTVLDLNALLTGLAEPLQETVGPDVNIVFNLDPALGRITADAGQVHQIILNLAKNARQAMPSGGTLTVETRDALLQAGDERFGPDLKPGDYVVLTVRDTGAGMDAETQSRIFEPFFTTRDIAEATGLGLAVTYGVVKQSGGQIAVESTVGAGSAFYVFLPTSRDDTSSS